MEQPGQTEPVRAGSGARPKVVIIGGGFGGLHAAKNLANKEVRVVLVDQRNYHTFQPLLYQVALSVLSPGEICSPLRHILRGSRNTETILEEATGFDLEGRRVRLGDGSQIGYDYLIVAAGARHAYFGHDEWEKDAPGLKTIEDAVGIRRRLLLAFEKAERRAVLTGEGMAPTFAVIGGGPTGVELAGAIADLARYQLAQDFKAIDTKKARVKLFEADRRILGAFSEQSSQRAQRQLEELGVEVYTNARVERIESGRLETGGRWVPADVILWASGVAASPLGRELSREVDRNGRVPVEADLSLPGHPEVFVIGDMSVMRDAEGKPVPGLAAAAVQQGKWAAENILRDLEGKRRLPFVYKDRGIMATIGHARAVAELGRAKLWGWSAWVLWSIVHVYQLISFRNRLTVMRQWIWAYLTRSGASPLITEYHSSDVMESVKAEAMKK